MANAKPGTAMPGGHDGDSDDDALADIGHVLAGFRLKAKMTRKQVGRLLGMSEKTVEKFERGERGLSNHIYELSTALGLIPLVREQLVALAIQPKAVRERIRAGERLSPEPHDHAVLHALDAPACLLMPATFDIVSANTSFDRIFPGACEIGNLVVWILTDPRARQVLPPHYWTQEAHRYVSAASSLWPGLLTRSRVDQLYAELEVAPEFEQFWTTLVPIEEVYTTTIAVRDLETGVLRTWYRHTLAPEFPHIRPWRLYTLVPTIARSPDSVFIVPAGMARRRSSTTRRPHSDSPTASAEIYSPPSDITPTD